MKKTYLIAAIALAIAFVWASPVLAAPVTQSIKIDHFGYRPNDVKVAIFTADPGATVQIRNTSDTVVYTIPTNGGSITSMGADGQPSGDSVWQVNFTPFNTAGSYRLYVPAWSTQSYDFNLSENVYNDVGKVALKTYYYQRCGVAHPRPFADAAWSDRYVCHDYLTACTAAETNYGTLDLSGGWHDAGDYNKYVWSDLYLAMVMLMTAYENNPGVFYDGQLTIPGGANGVPDILDEVKVEIDWLLKMQMPDGKVLSRVWDDSPGAADSCPPSNAVQPHYYYSPDVDAAGVFTGSVAMFARICAANGDPYGNVAALKQAAIRCWNDYLLGQADGHARDPWWSQKLWAAAELWRMDQSITSARDFVEGKFSDWATAFMEGYNTAAPSAYAYIQTPGANATIVSKMKTAIGVTVNDYFVNRGPYRDSMKDTYYHWGSNKCRGSWGVLLLEAAKLGATGSHTAAECRELAQDFLHAFHGQNPMGMVYLTNMAAYGGEHSSFQFFHGWFGCVTDPESVAWYRGLPPGVTEPDYPYFKGLDSYGIGDDNHSLYGPCPGFVVGGPNKDYSGSATPPKGATYYERFYRDWIDNSPGGWYRTKVWELNENSISYQAPYVALVAGFMSAVTPPPPDSTPPAAPTTLTATAIKSSQINLDWSDNSEGDLLSYDVYRGATSGGPYKLRVADVVGSAYSDIGLAPSTTYYYVVTAVDTTGNESARSTQAGATTPSSAGTMHVSAISGGVQKNPRGYWEDIYIVNNAGAAVASATVTVTWDGWDNGTQSHVTVTQSGVTGSTGKVHFISIIDSGSICVDNVTHATLTYDPGQNVVTCGGF